MSEVTLVVNETPIVVQVAQPSVNVAVIQPPNIEVVPSGPPGPRGPAGRPGGQGFAMDLPAITPGVPVLVPHNLHTTDVSVVVVMKEVPGVGEAPGRLVQTGVKIISADTLQVEISGAGIPTAAGAFRVGVRPAGAGSDEAVEVLVPVEVYVQPGPPAAGETALIWLDQDSDPAE